jgi:hypothetical protein
MIKRYGMEKKPLLGIESKFMRVLIYYTHRAMSNKPTESHTNSKGNVTKKNCVFYIQKE